MTRTTPALVRVDVQKNKQFLSRVKGMLKELSGGNPHVQPSKMWEDLNRQGLMYLKEYGYENFKRTMVRQYFANTPLWMLNQQILFLILHLNPVATISAFIRSIRQQQYVPFSRIDTAGFHFITLLVWRYTRSQDSEGILQTISEPIIGNPPPIYEGTQLISQDNANSFLEYQSIYDSIDPKKTRTVMELGAGSGRDAYVFLKLNPHIEKYVIIDIPPALAVAERYLSDVFPDKRVFKYRPFQRFSEIQKEFESCEIAFFLPSQIEQLPDAWIDLTVNISSLHEMRHEQIQYYFDHIRRMTSKRGYFYIKEWKKGIIVQENTCIYMDDYPVKPYWKSLYRRTPKIQIKFFEQLLQLE